MISIKAAPGYKSKSIFYLFSNYSRAFNLYMAASANDVIFVSMLHKLRGIVFKTTPYGESSVVVQLFTDKFGMQSYIINGVKKPRAKIKMNMLQPLHLLELVAYHKESNAIQRVSELRPSPIFSSIPYDVMKSTITIFLNEVLYKSIRQQTADEDLFDFVFNSISWFDETEEASVNFHLSFLLKLTRFLGFGLDNMDKTGGNYFDLREGAKVFASPSHADFMDPSDMQQFFLLFNTPFENLFEIKLSNSQRRSLLDKIVIYYNLHAPSFGVIRSRQVLEEILS